MSGGPYGPDFYLSQDHDVRRSASVVVPLVLELVHPSRVVDVGCGLGTWLSVFRQCGVSEVLGIDGSHVSPSMLAIPAGSFRAYDLTQPLHLNQDFDLAVSLEVAEHLPQECAETFVASLTRLAPVVLFSAAIPYQAGRHHVNLQWPEYWVERFAGCGYEVIDCLRRKIWDNEDVQWWYAQNTLLFVDRNHLEKAADLAQQRTTDEPRQLSIVHPKLYLSWVDWCRSEHHGAG